MKDPTGLADPLGGAGKIVEADETYFGKLETPRPRNPYSPPPTKSVKSGGAQKRAVFGLVERGGKSRMFHVHRATKEEIGEIVRANASRKSELHTDENRIYEELGREFSGHHTVHHSSDEYVRYEGERVVHSNSLEACSRSSSVACTASVTTAAKPTCTATLRSLIFATTAAPR